MGWIALFVVCAVVWAFFLVGKKDWLVKSVVYGGLTCGAVALTLVFLKLAVVALKVVLFLAPLTLVALVTYFLFFKGAEKKA